MPALNTQGTYGSPNPSLTLRRRDVQKVYHAPGTHKIVRLLTAITPKKALIAYLSSDKQPERTILGRVVK